MIYSLRPMPLMKGCRWMTCEVGETDRQTDRQTDVCVCVCVCVLGRGGNMVFASRALVVVGTDGSVSDWLQ